MATSRSWVSPARSLYRLMWEAVDWLFPPICPGCGREGERWCKDCQSETLPLAGDYCPVCCNPATHGNLCSECEKEAPAFCAARSFTIYAGPIKEAIHSLKYSRNIAIAEPLSDYLLAAFQAEKWQVDLVVPVPLGHSRLMERGFNQAAELARPFALTAGLPFSPDVLVRKRETHAQAQLGRADRIQNLAGAFRAEQALVTGRRILVIDDVLTTGATLQNCALALLQAGASQVFGLTVARAGHTIHRKENMDIPDTASINAS